MRKIVSTRLLLVTFVMLLGISAGSYAQVRVVVAFAPPELPGV